MPRVAALLAFLLASSTGIALADLAPKPTTSGRNPGPAADLAGIEVVMAEEEVDLLLRGGGDGPDHLEVRATFRMQNHGETATFETGFPCGAFRNFESFAITIDGKPVDFDLVDRRAASPPPGSERPRKGIAEWWYVWDATYPGGTASTHVVTYTVAIERSRETQRAGYVLHTGAGWKGPIGKAVITLRAAGGLTLDHVLRAGPTASSARREDRFEWTFAALEPTREHDIEVLYSDRTFAEQLAEARAEAAAKWEGRVRVAKWLEDAPGRGARDRFSAEELAAYVDAIAALVPEARVEAERTILPRADGDEIRAYAENPNALLRWIDDTAELVEKYPAGQHPESESARAVLADLVRLGEAFLAGNLYAGGERIDFAWRGKLDTPEQRARKEKSDAQRRANVVAWVERGRKLLGAG